VTVTCASGTTAPLGSVTVPVIRDVPVCACATSTATDRITPREKRRNSLFILCASYRTVCERALIVTRLAIEPLKYGVDGGIIRLPCGHCQRAIHRLTSRRAAVIECRQKEPPLK